MTGQAVIRALVRRGVRPRAAVRVPDQLTLFADLADPVIADFSDEAQLAEAFAGVDAAYYIPPAFNAAEPQFAANVIAAAERTSLPRLVYHSVLHAATPGMRHHARKAAVEVMLRESSLTWTILQPAMYMQTPLFFLNAERTELNPAFNADRVFTPVDLLDVGEVAASILTTQGHDFATYELSGGEPVSFRDMAHILSVVFARPVTSNPLNLADLIRRLSAARSLSENAVLDLSAMLTYYDRHGLRGNSAVLRMILGRDPTSFETAARRTLSSAPAA